MGSSHQTTNIEKHSVDNQKIDTINDNTHTVNNNWDVHHTEHNKHNGDVIVGSAVNLGNSVNTGNRCMGGPGDCPTKLMNLMNMDATTAIIATPEQAIALLNLNANLQNPYEIKGAYLI